MTLEYPTIHLNGSSKSTLVKDLRAAYRAVQEAAAAVAQTAPHGRDYYVKEDIESYRKARVQHDTRMEVLRTIAEDLATIAQEIEKQG